MLRQPRVDRREVLGLAVLRAARRVRAGRQREQRQRRGQRAPVHWYCDVSAGLAASPPSASTGALARTTVTVHSDSATTVDDTLPR